MSVGDSPRARELGIVTGYMEPGPLNGITDVPGVKVGHCTLIRGEGKLIEGQGPVRTGVTVVLPHGGNLFTEKVRAALHVINGFGKATGIAQIQELGVIETPIGLTNTLSVGSVWTGICNHSLAQNPDIGISTGTVNPVVLECNDGYLNDIRGRHVKEEHVAVALENASQGPCEEGNVGAGTGMSCLGFKGGIGTASRRLEGDLKDEIIGVLVLANFGGGRDLTIGGVPVGRHLAERWRAPEAPPGSIVMVVGTNAPVSERQLGRVARRCWAGLARVGSFFSNGSGDFVLSFSTENRVSSSRKEHVLRHIDDGSRAMASLFRGVIEATEEAVLNALFAAKTMTGRDGHVRRALPVAEVMEILGKGR